MRVVAVAAVRYEKTDGAVAVVVALVIDSAGFEEDIRIVRAVRREILILVWFVVLYMVGIDGKFQAFPMRSWALEGSGGATHSNADVLLGNAYERRKSIT